MTGHKEPKTVVTDRTKKLLQAFCEGRFLDRQQVEIIAGFRSIRRANRFLLAMHRKGLLKRFFTISAARGRKTIYTLSRKGAAVSGESVNMAKTYPDNSVVPSSEFVEHQLNLNWLWIAAKHRPLSISDARLVRWLNFKEPLSKSIPLVPDGYFEIEHHQIIHPLFCEVDHGTESLKVWEKKIGLYLKLALSGEFESLFHQPQFRVLVVALSGRRIAGIRKTVLKSTDKIFRFATLEQINRDGLLASIWLKPAADQSSSLL